MDDRFRKQSTDLTKEAMWEEVRQTCMYMESVCIYFKIVARNRNVGGRSMDRLWIQGTTIDEPNKGGNGKGGGG